MQKVRVFADTNVILESFRTNCWAAITHHFAIETVEKCVEETLTGNLNDPRHVAVPNNDLHTGLTGQYSVNRKDLAALVLSHPTCSVLDDGEKHLFAWLFTNKILPCQWIVVSTADKAALVASHNLGWLDCMISLEELAQQAGVARGQLDALALQYRQTWLSRIKTQIRLGIIP
jgi:hypothetical protein